MMAHEGPFILNPGVDLSLQISPPNSKPTSASNSREHDCIGLDLWRRHRKSTGDIREGSTKSSDGSEYRRLSRVDADVIELSLATSSDCQTGSCARRWTYEEVIGRNSVEAQLPAHGFGLKPVFQNYSSLSSEIQGGHDAICKGLDLSAGLDKASRPCLLAGRTKETDCANSSNINGSGLIQRHPFSGQNIVTMNPHEAVVLSTGSSYPSLLRSNSNQGVCQDRYIMEYPVFTAEKFAAKNLEGSASPDQSSTALAASNQSDTQCSVLRSRFMSKLSTKRSLRAPRMRWTSTLHAHFVHAVELLGGHERAARVLCEFRTRVSSTDCALVSDDYSSATTVVEQRKSMDCVGLSTSFKESPNVGDLHSHRSSVSVKQTKKTDNVAFRCGRSFNVLIAMQDAYSIKDMKSKTLYEILGIGENATAKDVKAAYRELAKRFHPDVVSPGLKNAGDRAFVEIHDAYATLADPHGRAEYDRQLGDQMRAGGYGYRSGQCHSYSYSCPYCKGGTWETDQCW